MDPEIARALSVIARNMVAQGYDDLAIFRHLAAVHAPYDSVLFFWARARGHALFLPAPLTRFGVWPANIIIPYPTPPSLTPPGQGIEHVIHATVRVHTARTDSKEWLTLVSDITSPSASAVARALIELDAIQLCATYDTTLVDWYVDWWE